MDLKIFNPKYDFASLPLDYNGILNDPSSVVFIILWVLLTSIL